MVTNLWFKMYTQRSIPSMLFYCFYYKLKKLRSYIEYENKLQFF